jgi:hypothetical protein
MNTEQSDKNLRTGEQGDDRSADVVVPDLAPDEAEQVRDAVTGAGIREDAVDVRPSTPPQPSEFVQTIDQRLADIRQLEENLRTLRRFYFTLLWEECGGMSTRTAADARRRAEATQDSLDVLIDDLAERAEVDP